MDDEANLVWLIRISVSQSLPGANQNPYYTHIIHILHCVSNSVDVSL